MVNPDSTPAAIADLVRRLRGVYGSRTTICAAAASALEALARERDTFVYQRDNLRAERDALRAKVAELDIELANAAKVNRKLLEWVQKNTPPKVGDAQ
jgi:hypothetical protein